MDKTPQKPRAPRWMRIAFGVSLALNLAVVGILVGTFARFAGPPSRGHGMLSYAMPYVRALPRDVQREMFRTVRSQLPEDIGGRQARRVLYGEMIEALKADPFDPGRVQSILDRQNDAAVAVQTAAHGVWLERIGAMSLEDRSVYADAVSEVMRHGKAKREKPAKE